MAPQSEVYVGTRIKTLTLDTEPTILNWGLAVVRAARKLDAKVHFPLINHRIDELRSARQRGPITEEETRHIAESAAVVIIVDDLSPGPCLGLGYDWQTARSYMRPIIPVCIDGAVISRMATDAYPPPVVAPLRPQDPAQLERAIGPILADLIDRTNPASELRSSTEHLTRLGKGLEKSRRRRGMSVGELAARAGTTEAYITAFETGKLDLAVSVHDALHTLLQALPSSPGAAVLAPSQNGAAMIFDFLKRHNLPAGKFDAMLEACARYDAPLTERDLWAVYNAASA